MPHLPHLTSGDLRFSTEVAGPPDSASAVLFFHGFPDDNTTFRHQAAALAAAGHRVYSPRLRGYEPSSQPGDGDYSLTALASDAVCFADEIDAERLHIVGHDWGAAVGYAACATAPDRFMSLSALAVPSTARIPEAVRRVPRQLLRSWYMTFFQVRGLADWAVSAGEWALVRRLWRSWSPGYSIDDEMWNALRSTFEAPGVRGAMLAYYRKNATPPLLLGLRKNNAMRLTTIPVRTLGITGADDGCIDTRLFDHSMLDADFPEGLVVERVANAGHFVHLEQPEKVSGLLLDWIGAADGPS